MCPLSRPVLCSRCCCAHLRIGLTLQVHHLPFRSSSRVIASRRKVRQALEQWKAVSSLRAASTSASLTLAKASLADSTLPGPQQTEPLNFLLLGYPLCTVANNCRKTGVLLCCSDAGSAQHS
jgi:hypothetical protein